MLSVESVWTSSFWKSSCISMEGVRWIIDGTRKRALKQVVMDEMRVSRLFTDDTCNSSKLLWLRTDDTLSKATVWSMPLCSCLSIGSGVVEDTGNAETLAMDNTRGEVWKFVMRGLENSCRGMVLQRAVRGVLASSLLHGDAPVWMTRGPTPLRRCIGAMFLECVLVRSCGLCVLLGM